MNADEFTPTTEQVREGYSIDVEGEYRDPINAAANQRAAARAFNRWLAAHDAEVLAPAVQRTADRETIREAVDQHLSGYTRNDHTYEAWWGCSCDERFDGHRDLRQDWLSQHRADAVLAVLVPVDRPWAGADSFPVHVTLDSDATDLIRAEALEAAARALHGEFQPLTNRVPSWRSAYLAILEGAAEYRKAAGG